MNKDFIAPSVPTHVRASFERQATHCRNHGAPLTAQVVEAILAGLAGAGEFRARIRAWGPTIGEDALSLRAAAGLHALHLAGIAPELTTVYAGQPVDSAAAINAVIDQHDAALLPWLDGPPQTNEAARSANYMAALLWLQEQGLPNRWDCVEIGSSAGINLMMDRYAYRLGDVDVGPSPAVMHIAPDWRGARFILAPKTGWAIDGLHGCDVAPVNLLDDAAVFRLRAYIWADHVERMERLDQAVAAARQKPPELVAQDAVAFVQAALKKPQQKGVTRVLMHSVVWQYLGPERQKAITALMEAAGRAASPERPLAWISVEFNRELWRHELRARYWPGAPESRLLATPHPHGAWINWIGG